MKICGITNWRDARLAVDAGADALGFNFFPPSPRYIHPREAARIVRRLPATVTKVGVFVNERPEAVHAIARAVGLQAVQLHGEETPRRVSELARLAVVIKAFRMRPGFALARLGRYAGAKAFLLDGFRAGLRGGTGKPFDWSVARRASRYGRIIVAGGLGPENVAEAIAGARPYAIDVASGVEARPGKKDPARLRELMRQVERERKKRR
ncbi:MAG TPA: phosphoribosylanthranilate isomerase [Candidatus Acidoferrales bacterium]|nr:phosphoribosylanthranilate isomerase [Candidatus Acidoferrales bacterium]